MTPQPPAVLLFNLKVCGGNGSRFLESTKHSAALTVNGLAPHAWPSKLASVFRLFRNNFEEPPHVPDHLVFFGPAPWATQPAAAVHGYSRRGSGLCLQHTDAAGARRSLYIYNRRWLFPRRRSLRVAWNAHVQHGRPNPPRPSAVQRFGSRHRFERDLRRYADRPCEYDDRITNPDGHCRAGSVG